MRTIGLLHGMSSVATGDYYRRINDGVNARLGGHERPQLLLWSVNFGDIERFVRARPGVRRARTSPTEPVVWRPPAPTS